MQKFVTFVTYIEGFPEKKKIKKNFPDGVTSVTSVTRGVNRMKNNNTACHGTVTFVTVLRVFWYFLIYIACGKRSRFLLKQGEKCDKCDKFRGQP